MEITRQSDYYGIPRQAAAPLPDESVMRDYLGGPRIMAGLNRISNDFSDRAMEVYEDAREHPLTGPFDSISGIDQYINPNSAETAQSIEPMKHHASDDTDDSAFYQDDVVDRDGGGLFDKFNDFAQHLEPSFDRLQDAVIGEGHLVSPDAHEDDAASQIVHDFGPNAMAHQILPGWDMMKDLAHGHLPSSVDPGESARSVFELLMAGKDDPDEPRAYEDYRGFSDPYSDCMMYGHDWNKGQTKCNDCGAKNDFGSDGPKKQSHFLYADEEGGGESAPAPAPDAPPVFGDASTPTPASLPGGPGNTQPLFTIQYMPGMFPYSNPYTDPHPSNTHGGAGAGQPLLGS